MDMVQGKYNSAIIFTDLVEEVALKQIRLLCDQEFSRGAAIRIMLICIGKANKDWNYSAPHGAVRLMSRTAAKSSFTVSEFKHQMKGIYTTSVNSNTLDECPMAYKSMEDIVKQYYGYG